MNGKDGTVEKELYTLPEAGYALALSTFGVRNLIWKGLLPYVQYGKKQFIAAKEITLFIEKHTKCEKN